MFLFLLNMRHASCWPLESTMSLPSMGRVDLMHSFARVAAAPLLLATYLSPMGRCDSMHSFARVAVVPLLSTVFLPPVMRGDSMWFARVVVAPLLSTVFSSSMLDLPKGSSRGSRSTRFASYG